MVLKLEDGTIWFASELLAGNTQDYKDTQLNFSQVGSTSSYVATAALNDGTGRNEEFRFDNPNNSTFVRISRKVK